MQLVNSKQYSHHPLEGLRMEFLYGTVRPDGDGRSGEVNWKAAARGTRYFAQLTDNQSEEYVKVKNDGRNDDWALVRGVISQRLGLSDFTDGGAAAGTADLNGEIPLGAVYQRSFLTDVTAAEGESTLTFVLGDGDDGTDDDRYNTGTPSVAAADTSVDLGVPSGAVYHDAAVTPRVTLTEDDDFTDLTSIGFTVTMIYIGVAP